MSEHKVELDVRLNTDRVGKDFDDLKKQAKAGAESVGDALDDMQDSMDDMADKTKASAKETEAAYDRLNRTIKEQQETVRKLKQEYASAVLEFGEASDEAKQLAKRIEEASAELAQNQTALQQAADAADRYDRSLDDVADSLAESADQAGLFGDVLKGSLASAAIEKGIGLLASGVQSAVSEVLEMDSASKKLQGSIGATAEEMEGYNAVMNDMYTAGYGDSITEIADAMALVKQYTGEVDPTKIQQMAENAMTLDETFSGMDMEETLRGVDALMVNMGLDAEEAFDYIVVGAQNGLNKSNELTDNLAEYSSLWSQAGFSAEEMFTILQNGLDSGAYNLDKVNDFVKEFSISLSDGRIEENIGSFSARTQELFSAWQNGEATTKDAFYSIINDLSNMENQQEALTIASNTWSALGEDNAMAVITSLDQVNDTYSDVRGSMESLKEVRYDSLENQYKSLGRTMQTQIIQPMAQKLLPVAQKGLKVIADNLDIIVPVAGAAGAAMATIWVTKKAQGLIDRLKDTRRAVTQLVTGTTAQAAATTADTTATMANTAAKGAQATATVTATTAQTGLNAAMSANPIGLVVTAISGLVAGLAAFSALVGKSDAEKLAEDMRAAREEAEQTRDEYQELSEEYHNNSDEVMALWRQVQDLSEAENKSAAQKQKLSSLVDELNKKVPDLGLSYDELNDSLSQTAESIDEVVRAFAAQEAYDSAVEDRTQAAKDYNQTAAEQKEIAEQLADAEARLNEEIEENPRYYEEYGETVNGTQREVDKLREALEEAQGATEANSETLEQASVDAEYYGLMLADVDTNARNLINTALEQIDAIGRQDEAYMESVGYLSNLTNSYTSAKEVIQTQIESINADIEALKQKHQEAYDSAYTSITGQLGLFNTMTTESSLSVDEMMGALDSQITYLDTFSQNMQTAVSWGVNKGLLAQLSDGSAESAAILQTIVDAGYEKIMGPDGLNEKFGQVEEGKEKFSTTIADMETDFNKSMDALQTKLTETEEKMDLADELYKSGVNSIQGYINGTEELRDDLITQFQSLADSAKGAFNNTLEEHSPSKVFERSGKYTIQGAIIGAEDERPKLLRTYRDLGHSIVSAYDGALEDSASASRRMADVYDVVNAHSAGIGRQYRSGAAEILSGKSAGRNFTDEDLRKLAKEYGDITAAYWSNMKYVFDDREVGRMVRKVS